MSYRRLLAAILTPVLVLGFCPGVAATATPAATFVTPAPGLVSVVQSGTVRVGWTIAAGVTVISTTLAIQTSRPIGVEGCDLRWAPAGSAAVTGTEYLAQNLPLNRCYRFLLFLQTSTGRATAVSAPVIPAPSGWGATATFTNPYVDGVVSYATSARIGWAERDTFGSAIVSRSVIVQTAPAVSDSCAGVTWSAGTALSVSGTSFNRELRRAYCYRYVLTIRDAAGFRSELTSGALRVASALPSWTGTLDLHRASAFASQATSTWCVAASSQMMLNIILGQSDTSSASQSTYIAWGQAHDSANYSAGTNPAGWASIMDRYGGAHYSIGSYGDSTSALKAAATRLRITNRPVGLLVWRGRHAWVMSGFEATADPAVTTSFSVTAVYVSGPLYPRPANAYGYDPAPDTRYTPGQLATYFSRYYDTGLPTWNETWVVVLP